MRTHTGDKPYIYVVKDLVRIVTYRHTYCIRSHAGDKSYKYTFVV